MLGQHFEGDAESSAHSLCAPATCETHERAPKGYEAQKL